MTVAIQLCQQCHARLSPETGARVCPACGGALAIEPGPNLDSTPAQADHRGILMPRRHAVGGVITPR